jgi:hypothetical protein
MTVRYWIARNVEDQFRNEPRNVGIIVRERDAIAARFVGEKESGAIDRRLLGGDFDTQRCICSGSPTGARRFRPAV